METPLDLTVIIPNYNTRRLLDDCLSSIYEHTRGIGFEVISLMTIPGMAARTWWPQRIPM